MLGIVIHPDPLLRTASAAVKEVNDDTRRLVDDMFETMYEARGVGLAAVQVGTPLRLFITHVAKDQRRVFINPQIIQTSIDEEVAEEGCLSIPGVNGDVRRASQVKIQALNRRGRPFLLEATDVLARAIQHENDHLDGVLFVDHLGAEERDRVLAEYSAR